MCNIPLWFPDIAKVMLVLVPTQFDHAIFSSLTKSFKMLKMISLVLHVGNDRQNRKSYLMLPSDLYRVNTRESAPQEVSVLSSLSKD
jgi:hypothetical protein